MTTWTLIHRARPFTENAQRSWHHHQRAREVKTWREAFAVLALEAHIPLLESVSIVAVPYLRDRRRQDVGACFPAVKAAIDGLCDAGVFPGDGPDELLQLTFLAPICGGHDALALTITHQPTGDGPRSAQWWDVDRVSARTRRRSQEDSLDGDVLSDGGGAARTFRSHPRPHAPMTGETLRHAATSTPSSFIPSGVPPPPTPRPSAGPAQSRANACSRPSAAGSATGSSAGCRSGSGAGSDACWP